MAAKKRPTTKQKKAVATKRPVVRTIHKRWLVAKKRYTAFLARRLHKSFSLSRKHDYDRRLTLPGYWSGVSQTFVALKKHKKTFIISGIVFSVASFFLVGLGSQENFSVAREAVDVVRQGLAEGDLSIAGEAGSIALSSLSEGITPTLEPAQQLASFVIVVFIWLTTVWLLRQHTAGVVVRFRDALYSAGAPIVASAVIVVVMVVQCLPILLGLTLYGAAQASGMLYGGVEAMLCWIAIGLLGLLSLYWLGASALAMVIVTLPGMYPFRALAIANTMIRGRRLQLLWRLLWAIFWGALAWALVLVLVWLLDAWLKTVWVAIEWLPVLPATIMLLGVITTMVLATYIYTLYRMFVEADVRDAE